ncbi:MAG: BCCT family transporter, partial [Alphaproteobacteria bacterium]|nr:BCCT family transporter [Alphaproteobacteria bacterium]
MEKDTKSNLQADTAVTQPEKASEIAEYTNSGIKAPPKLTLFALTLATALSLFGILEPEAFMETTQEMNHAFMMAAGHWVVIIGSLFMLSCFILAFSPLGRIRLGAPDSTPEFSTLSWLSMLFAAGMGSGLLFWGVAEPIMHFASPPPLNGAMETAGAARMALVITYLHWTLHPWGIYASGALCIAYFSFCKGHSLLPSAPFRAALPKRFRISQAAGDIVDVTCVISMLLGLSAAMAMGTMQIASGTIVLGNTATDGGMIPTYLAIVGLLVAVYMLSASTSINKGIKRLSEINMLLVVLLAILIMFGTSVSQSISTLFQALIDFTRFLPELLFTPLGAEKQPEWNETWTANYFLSWIAWVPFVGIFVARISRGRTIREFVMGVIIAPSLFSFLWFAVLGGASIDAQLGVTLDLVGDIENYPGSG